MCKNCNDMNKKYNNNDRYASYDSVNTPCVIQIWRLQGISQEQLMQENPLA